MGFRIAKDLVDRGADVLLCDLKPVPDALPEGPGRAVYHQADISDFHAVEAAVDKACTAFGGVDLLANVAGVLWFGRDESVLNMDMEVWDRVMAINLKSMAVTARLTAPLMMARGGGAMVHFSSIQCLRGDDRPQDAYQAAKAGVIALSKSLAIQLARHGIRSNAICPGPTESPMQARWDEDQAARKAVAAHVPLGRVGRVEDLSNAALFLLSEKASFITGTELIVDGGLLARP
jgi:NAD(P)-dependent dehydrogenase (short-subunit alcohol dehydrogenase family)